MRIGQLPSVSNSDKNDLIAIERGGKTYSVKKSAIVVDHAMLAVEFQSFSSLPQTINSDLITEDHELVRYELGSDGAWIDGTVTTTNGSVTVSGTMSGTTTLKLILGIPEHI